MEGGTLARSGGKSSSEGDAMTEMEVWESAKRNDTCIERQWIESCKINGDESDTSRMSRG